jgi:hypothetical protein
MGIALREARTCPDEEGEIVRHVNDLRRAYTYVFTSGGIGPTHDDITADSVARAFGVPIDVREDARAILAAYYEDPAALNAARLRMARIPEGAELILNPVSQAPGFRLGNVFVMAGVPVIFRAMVESARPMLTGGAPMLSWSFRVPMSASAATRSFAAVSAPRWWPAAPTARGWRRQQRPCGRCSRGLASRPRARRRPRDVARAAFALTVGCRSGLLFFGGLCPTRAAGPSDQAYAHVAHIGIIAVFLVNCRLTASRREACRVRTTGRPPSARGCGGRARRAGRPR